MRFFPLLLLCLVVGTATAQPAPRVQLEMDHAVFAHDAAASLLEIYLAFDASSLRYEPEGDVYVARVPIYLQVVRRSGAVREDAPEGAVWSDSVALQFPVRDVNGLQAGQYFVHQLHAEVAPGEYALNVRIPGGDAGGRRALELRRDVLVPDFTRDDLAVSDVTLATAIRPSEDLNSLFYKNGFEVRPNPNALYGQGIPTLFYYAEVYRPDAVAGPNGQYGSLVYVSDAGRSQPVAGLEKRVERPVRSPDVVVGTMDLSALPNGSYFLHVVVLDRAGETVAEQRRKFFVFNPAVERQAPVAVEHAFEASPFAAMPEEELADEIQKIELISSNRERRSLERVEDLEERRRAVMEFWRYRDPDPATHVNEYREAFLERVQYADVRYSTNRTEGWRTDRGRVVVKYGMPSNVESHHYDQNAAPYEIWHYHDIPGEGQAYFVFADRTGFGQFELVHATVAGERHMPDWQQSLVNR